MSSNNKKTSGPKDEKKNATTKEDSQVGAKDDAGSTSTGSNGTAAGDPNQPGSKPSSAGATVREAAQRLLALAARGEWPPVEQVLKTMEKAVQNAGEDGLPPPLASIMDTVNKPKNYIFKFIKLFFFFQKRTT